MLRDRTPHGPPRTPRACAQGRRQTTLTTPPAWPHFNCSSVAAFERSVTSLPFRRHQLAADRDEQFAVNLDGKMRLVFDIANDPVPRRADGGIDLGLVTAIRILEVVDYHDD